MSCFQVKLDLAQATVTTPLPWRFEQRENGSERLIVRYDSLGNFVFGGFDYPEARRGQVFRQSLEKSGLLAW